MLAAGDIQEASVGRDLLISSRVCRERVSQTISYLASPVDSMLLLLITSKRYRAWQKSLEKIMFTYLDLCIDLKRGRFTKDRLIHYRIVCQQVNVTHMPLLILSHYKSFTKLSNTTTSMQNAAKAMCFLIRTYKLCSTK